MKKILFPIVILAGGLATRLKPLTEKIPKSLIPIHDQPFIIHQLRSLKKQGIHQVILCVGHLGEMIADVVGDGSRYGLNVNYCFDGEKLLGTAGAIKKALPLLGENFFVQYGDTYLPCDYAKVQQAFLQNKKLSLMTIFKNEDRWDRSNVEYHDHRIIVYDKKNRNARMQHIDFGLGVFHRNAFAQVQPDQDYDLAHLYQELLKQQQLASYENPERFYEIGSFAGIQDLSYYLDQSVK